MSKPPQHKRAYCRGCQHDQLFERREISHGLHLLITICTLGLWTISWISATVGLLLNPWHCKQCSCITPEFRERTKRKPKETS